MFRESRNDSIDTDQTLQHFVKDNIVNAHRLASAILRPIAGCGAAVQAGYPMGFAMNPQSFEPCIADSHLSAAPASLWLKGDEDQMQPGEGSA